MPEPRNDAGPTRFRQRDVRGSLSAEVIHPTTAAHFATATANANANAMVAATIPEPRIHALMAFGLVAVVSVTRRGARGDSGARRQSNGFRAAPSAARRGSSATRCTSVRFAVDSNPVARPRNLGRNETADACAPRWRRYRVAPACRIRASCDHKCRSGPALPPHLRSIRRRCCRQPWRRLGTCVSPGS